MTHSRQDNGADSRAVAPAVERVELARVAGKMLGAIDLLRKQCAVLYEQGVGHERLANRLADLVWARERIVTLADTLPEGPMEAFAREHPLMDDPLDGPFCGYGHKHGTPYKCSEPDWPKHWDAWELMGTRHKRPPMARRPTDA